MTKAHELRTLLSKPGVIIAPAAYDALSAKMIETVGFSLIGTTGYGMHGTLLGVPDNGMLAFNEVASTLGKMADAVKIPIMADAEGGYGNAINTIRTVRELEKAGIAGLFIEDQKLPPNCPFFQKTELISIEEMVGKIKAAIDARNDDDFVVVARTDAPFDEAIDRCNAYAEAGADMVKAIPTNRGELEAFPELVRAPMHLGFVQGKGVNDGLTAYDAGEIGYKIVTFPFTCLFSNVKAVLGALRSLKEHGTDESVVDEMVSVDEYFNFIDADYYRDLGGKYLPA